MASRVGALFGSKHGVTRISTTQQEIANLLGVSRETTSVELKKLQLKKLITYSRKNYVLYTKKLSST